MDKELIFLHSFLGNPVPLILLRTSVGIFLHFIIQHAPATHSMVQVLEKSVQIFIIVGKIIKYKPNFILPIDHSSK